VWKKKPNGSEEFYFYGVGGQKLGTYQPATDSQFGTRMVLVSTNLYFGGKVIRAQGQAVVTDRLGSVRAGSGPATRYFPYGEEQQTTAQDRDNFATYYRDSSTGLDYADQRYYGSTMGRFLTPDPYRASGGPASPQSWNRYAYAEGDPANGFDPTGLKVYFGCEYDDVEKSRRESSNQRNRAKTFLKH